MPSLRERFIKHRYSLLTALLISFAVLGFIAVALPYANPFNSSPVKAGIVAQQDYVAPAALSFESKLLTDARKAEILREVTPIYNPPDPGVARKQVERLRSTLGFISSVRGDEYASEEQRLADLAALEYIQLSPETSQAILSLTHSRWQAVQQEAIVVLEQVMRTTIREDSLEETVRRIPTLISLSMPEDQARIVVVLAQGFAASNSTFNEELTQAAKDAAVAAVQPVIVSYKPGETIVTRGDVISASDFEVLQAFQLETTAFRWQDMAGAAAITLVVMAFMNLFLLRVVSTRQGQVSVRGLALTAGLFLVFLFSGRLIIPGRTVVPYLFPIAAYSLLISSQFGVRQSIITTLALAVLVTYGLPYSTELSLYYLLGSLFGVLVLDRGKRVSSFFWAGLVIAASGTLVAAGYRLPRPETDWIGIATIAGASLVNGIASTSIALLVQHFLAQMMGNVTALQLYELSRPDHPLLKQLLQKAPGTYQHSLQVANMVEQAAEEIGADALLARVGALYHDIGKIENPAYFIENQVLGSVNPHDLIPAQESASIIIRHVDDGLSLAKKYHLPPRIRDFIAEHHGASITRYQYNRAQQETNGEESIKESDFKYPGPHPHTRETALLMLADGTEARVRAEHPQNEEELRSLVKSVITQRLSSGYLHNSDLTLNDLTKIEISFTDSLRGIYHPRLKYPSQPETLAGENKDREITRPTASILLDPPLTEGPEITNLLQSENDPH